MPQHTCLAEKWSFQSLLYRSLIVVFQRRQKALSWGKRLHYHADVSSKTSGLNLVCIFIYNLTLCLRAAIVLANLRSITWAFVTWQWDKDENLMCWLIDNLGLDTTKPVLEVSDQVIHKPACSVTKIARKLKLCL